MKSLLLIISGSVAAVKAPELIRGLQKRDVEVDVILTRGGAEFITPLAIASLTGRKCYTELFSLTDEVEMGHIQLSRKADAILVAPASADILAKMAAGLADDLATTALLATNKPVYVAPAMNVQMWNHPATQRNVAQLRADGLHMIDPEEGELACGEIGAGRMAEPENIIAQLLDFAPTTQALAGKRALVTAGPTHEPIDPVRFIGNHSSGKQGIAIAKALADAGADVTLILGPVGETIPAGLSVTHITTADEMLSATQQAHQTGIDIAICAAAVADWAPIQASKRKLKKRESSEAPAISLKENPDILAWLSQQASPRPALVIGFAAETNDVEANAISKLQRKGCDWLLANDVSNGQVFGTDTNAVTCYQADGNRTQWAGSKQQVADSLVQAIISHYSTTQKAAS